MKLAAIRRVRGEAIFGTAGHGELGGHAEDSEGFAAKAEATR